MRCFFQLFTKYVFQLRLLLLCLLLFASNSVIQAQDFKLVLLGIAQDAGAPHIGCSKECCTSFANNNVSHKVVSLALIENKTNNYWIFDASPDISEQLRAVNEEHMDNPVFTNPKGVFLTHAHIGHYTGLMYFGREGMNANGVPVYVMPRMESYLKNNGPWSQLVSINNIQLFPLKAEHPVILHPAVKVKPFYVPHRDEFSETVGYKIEITGKTVLFIPDVDNWSKISPEVIQEMKSADYLFLDATFYSGNELPNRNINEIPHPLVTETMQLVDSWKDFDQEKLILIHFNHSNPLLIKESAEYQLVKEKGITIGKTGMAIEF